MMWQESGETVDAEPYQGWSHMGLESKIGRLPALSGFPGGSDSKESGCKAGNLGSIPGSGKSPGEGNGHPQQCSCLENSMSRGDLQSTAHEISESDTTEWLRLSPIGRSPALSRINSLVKNVDEKMFADNRPRNQSLNYQHSLDLPRLYCPRNSSSRKKPSFKHEKQQFKTKENNGSLTLKGKISRKKKRKRNHKHRQTKVYISIIQNY